MYFMHNIKCNSKLSLTQVQIYRRAKYMAPIIPINPKNCGGGRILPGAQEIACHFSQDHTMVTKFLDFIKKHPKYKVFKSFFYYLDRCSRNSAETEPRS